MRHYVITWRCPGGELYFFRGDNRREIFLPYISKEVVRRGWVKDERYARIFDIFPVFTHSSFAKNFEVDRLRIFPYEKPIQRTQILRPTKRPRREPPW